MKIIEFAFLCASADLNSRGGLNIVHLHDKFTMSDLPGLALVFHFAFQEQDRGWLETFPYFSDIRLAVEIKSDSDEEPQMQALNVTVVNQILTVAIGQMFPKPAHYIIRLLIEGDLQHTLDLFLD